LSDQVENSFCSTDRNNLPAADHAKGECAWAHFYNKLIVPEADATKPHSPNLNNSFATKAPRH
jgi:hypothetical protein